MVVYAGGDDLGRMLVRAQDLAVRGDHRESADAYAVAADQAEELDEGGIARQARTSARRNLVTAWARERWPFEGILLDDVHIHGDRRSEITRFAIRRPHRGLTIFRGLALDRPGFTYVSVSRRGRVTITSER